MTETIVFSLTADWAGDDVSRRELVRAIVDIMQPPLITGWWSIVISPPDITADR